MIFDIAGGRKVICKNVCFVWNLQKLNLIEDAFYDCLNRILRLCIMIQLVGLHVGICMYTVIFAVKRSALRPPPRTRPRKEEIPESEFMSKTKTVRVLVAYTRHFYGVLMFTTILEMLWKCSSSCDHCLKKRIDMCEFRQCQLQPEQIWQFSLEPWQEQQFECLLPSLHH